MKRKILFMALAFICLISPMSVVSAGKETQITHGERLLVTTSIYGNIITWAETATNSAVAYDLTIGKIIGISGGSDSNIPVYDNKILSVDRGSEYIVVNDASTGKETELAPVGFRAINLGIYGDNILYTIPSDNYSCNNVYLYNLTTRKETQLTTGECSYYSSAISGNKVAWKKVDQNVRKADIHIYDIPTRQTSNISASGPASGLDICGNVVVWLESHNGKNDIYMHDVAKHKTTRVTKNGAASQPAIYGNRIVWANSSSICGKWSSDIYMYEISTAKTTKITSSGSADHPDIYCNKIVYIDSRSSNLNNTEGSDIFLYDISAKSLSEKSIRQL